MTKTILAATMLAFLSVGFQTERSDAKEVDIILIGGAKVAGEILAMRDSSIVIAIPAGLSQEELVAEPNMVTVIQDSQINNVKAVGSSHTILGLLLGMPIGALTGCVIGSNHPDETNNIFNGYALGGGLRGCALGALAGAAVGYSLKTGSDLLISPSRRDFRILDRVARYPIVEPQYLRSLAP
jgi:hypothetical protein